MKRTINFYEFGKDFLNSIYKNNFSYEGLSSLYDYFVNLEDETGEEIEFDIIDICCNFTEYHSINDFKKDYGIEVSNLDDIREYTEVIPINDESFIIQNF